MEETAYAKSEGLDQLVAGWRARYVRFPDHRVPGVVDEAG